MSSNLPPIHFDVRRLWGGYVYRQDESGEEYIACKYGRIIAVNPDSGEDGCFAGVLVNGTTARKSRLWKLNLPVLWETESEIAVKIEFRTFTRIKRILKPLTQ